MAKLDPFEEARLIRLAKAYLLKHTLTGGVAKTGHKPLTRPAADNTVSVPRRE
jgi:hypothetical protein